MSAQNHDDSPKTRLPAVESGFATLWESLFKSPVHLDSALSKQPPRIKSILAQIVPPLLMRPASLAEKLGVGIPEGEPWSLDAAKLAAWRPARLIVTRSYGQMTSGKIESKPLEEDYPPWMIKEWKQNWGEKVAATLVEKLAGEPPLSLRTSVRKDRQALLKELTEGSKLPVRAELSKFSPLGIRLSGYAPILHLDAFQKGEFEIQDEGSQILALFALWPELFKDFLQTHPGPVASDFKMDQVPVAKDLNLKTVVDACAGAGGKSLAIGDLMKGKGRIYSYDVALSKLQALKRRATRAGLNNIKTVLLKENEEIEGIGTFAGQADTVLVDAPCSGWGVLRRNPDIKWRQNPEALKRLPVLQERLLNTYSTLVAPGGTLVYGLCTFRTDETLAVVKAFSEKNPAFRPLHGGYLGPGPCDGFYMHAWTRVKGEENGK